MKITDWAKQDHEKKKNDLLESIMGQSALTEKEEDSMTERNRDNSGSARARSSTALKGMAAVAACAVIAVGGAYAGGIFDRDEPRSESITDSNAAVPGTDTGEEIVGLDVTWSERIDQAGENFNILRVNSALTADLTVDSWQKAEDGELAGMIQVTCTVDRVFSWDEVISIPDGQLAFYANESQVVGLSVGDRLLACLDFRRDGDSGGSRQVLTPAADEGALFRYNVNDQGWLRLEEMTDRDGDTYVTGQGAAEAMLEFYRMKDVMDIEDWLASHGIAYQVEEADLPEYSRGTVTAVSCGLGNLPEEDNGWVNGILITYSGGESETDKTGRVDPGIDFRGMNWLDAEDILRYTNYTPVVQLHYDGKYPPFTIISTEVGDNMEITLNVSLGELEMHNKYVGLDIEDALKEAGKNGYLDSSLSETCYVEAPSLDMIGKVLEDWGWTAEYTDTTEGGHETKAVCMKVGWLDEDYERDEELLQENTELICSVLGLEDITDYDPEDGRGTIVPFDHRVGWSEKADDGWDIRLIGTLSGETDQEDGSQVGYGRAFIAVTPPEGIELPDSVLPMDCSATHMGYQTADFPQENGTRLGRTLVFAVNFDTKRETEDEWFGKPLGYVELGGLWDPESDTSGTGYDIVYDNPFKAAFELD